LSGCNQRKNRLIRESQMIIGVDFDNTIVRYDELFHRIAVERGLIPATVVARKNEVRDFLRRQNQEQEWTRLQGSVYGQHMAEAQPFSGVLEFFTYAARKKVPMRIISHKTRSAILGPPYDLQQTARAWLVAQGFFDPLRGGLLPEDLHFAETRQEKVRLISETGCTHFIDDLEETFLEPAFPRHIVQILFGHRQPPSSLPAVNAMADWTQIFDYVFAR
jgi:hypothetical protein